MEEKPYREAKMYALCGGNREACDFDFSRIHIDDYNGFFKGLPNVVYKKCQSLSFNIDLEVKRRHREATQEELEIINCSIQALKPRFSRYLMKILNHTLSKSKELNALQLSYIKIPSEYFSDFTLAVSRSRYLKELCLSDLTISDENAALLFNRLSPFRLNKLKLSHCNISSNLFQTICDWIRQDIPEGKEWKLTSLDLTENFFNDEQLSVIASLLRSRIHPEAPQEEEESSEEKETTQAETYSEQGEPPEPPKKFVQEKDVEQQLPAVEEAESSKVKRKHAVVKPKPQKDETVAEEEEEEEYIEEEEEEEEEEIYEEEEEEEEEIYEEEEEEEDAGETVETKDRDSLDVEAIVVETEEEEEEEDEDEEEDEPSL